MLDYLSNLNGDDWRTVSIVWQGILITVLAVTGIYQLLTIRAQAKKSHTIDICKSFATDPLLFECRKKLREGRINGDLALHPHNYAIQILTVLNYFDNLAIGIYQGVYDETMVRAYHEQPLRLNVGRYLKGDRAIIFNIQPEALKYLLLLANTWDNAPDAAHIPEDGFALTIKSNSQIDKIEIPGKTSKQTANQNQAAAKDSA